MSTPRETLLVAWARWDDTPGGEHAAEAMVDAVWLYSEGRALHLRRFLAAARRHGVTRDRALDLWENDEW